MNSEPTSSPEAQKTQKHAEIERSAKLIDANEADLKLLQDHLQKLLAKQPAANPTAPK
ncbi:MAG TPA: hypothetical protein VGI46_08005 [Candidatus Acidoferrum sp.]